jgi:hypothetical protein
MATDAINVQRKGPRGCSFGEKLTVRDLNALAGIVALGGSVKINGLRLSREDLQLLVEAVSRGSTFCVIRALPRSA